jgi:1L-myo-inositol 1-phosphate cytidylyltransferase
MKCLIVAAGQGVRLTEEGQLKPLVPVLGIPLIARVMRRVRGVGIEEFVVVSGYRGEELRTELDAFAAREGISVAHAIAEEWRRGNGVSLLAGKRLLDEPFLLTMCDHLVDPEIFRGLMSATHEPDTVTLAVDFNIEDPLNDPEDFTRVKCANGRIQQIGKRIGDFNAIDTGVFLCSPVVFDALEESQAQGDDSISGGINVLARWRKAHVFDIGGGVWIDVDDPVSFRKAEALLESGRL